jgi:hypothetical protein
MPDDERNDLRIGSWLPPYRDGATSGDDRLPVLSPYPRPALPAAPPPRRVRRVLIACGIAVAAGVAGMLTLVVPRDADPPAPVAERMVFPAAPEPSAPVSVRPAPARASAAPEPTGTTRTSEVAADEPATKWPAPTGVTRPAGPAAAADLTVGATVGLEVKDWSGFRVRHRDFLGRADRITSASSGLDRLDSRFVVRNGLGRGGCVSLESVNYPGYFLRHRDFVIHLDRRDRSPLFTQDATFCATPTRDGNAFVLESINYPAKAISLRRDLSLHLDDGAGTAFVVRVPL